MFSIATSLRVGGNPGLKGRLYNTSIPRLLVAAGYNLSFNICSLFYNRLHPEPEVNLGIRPEETEKLTSEGIYRADEENK